MDPNTEIVISSAAFVDSNGNNKVLHISNFSGSDNPERELLLCINQELLNYNYSIGWYTTGFAGYHEDTQEYLDEVDSDLVILHDRCTANNVDSIVEINSTGKPYIRVISILTFTAFLVNQWYKLPFSKMVIAH